MALTHDFMMLLRFWHENRALRTFDLRLVIVSIWSFIREHPPNSLELVHDQFLYFLLIEYPRTRIAWRCLIVIAEISFPWLAHTYCIDDVLVILPTWVFIETGFLMGFALTDVSQLSRWHETFTLLGFWIRVDTILLLVVNYAPLWVVDAVVFRRCSLVSVTHIPVTDFKLVGSLLILLLKYTFLCLIRWIENLGLFHLDFEKILALLVFWGWNFYQRQTLSYRHFFNSFLSNNWLNVRTDDWLVFLIVGYDSIRLDTPFLRWFTLALGSLFLFRFARIVMNASLTNSTIGLGWYWLQPSLLVFLNFLLVNCKKMIQRFLMLTLFLWLLLIWSCLASFLINSDYHILILRLLNRLLVYLSLRQGVSFYGCLFKP